MYYDYFGFKQAPFKITPDTSLFFPGGDRGAILEALIYAILNGEGIVKVVGEVGSGKTMLCRMLEKELPDKVEIVYLANPKLSPENTLHAIAFELKLPINNDTSRLQVMNDLQQYLVQQHAENKQVVVFVEEAQGMPLGTLEEIRLLSNLETQQNKLLQIVLFGQPELDEMISTPEIRQLKERITYSFQLKPFKNNDIRDYINTRLRACGYRTGELFSPSAIIEIERYSQGLLRRINILADKSLLAAYAATCQLVTKSHVTQAARDSEFAVGITKASRRRNYLLGTLAVAAAVIVSIVIVLWTGSDETKVTGSVKAAPEVEDVPASNDKGAVVPFESRVKEIVSTSTPAVEQEVAIAETGENIEITSSYDEIVEASIGEQEIVGTSEKGGDEQSAWSQEDEIETIEEEQEEIIPVAKEEDKTLDLRGQLLGMTAVFQLQDLGDSKLSERESYILNKQLRVLPPAEVNLSTDKSPNSDTCELCWSIIYRPLIDPENL